MAELTSTEKELARSCVSCGAQLTGKFCHACGEKAFDPHNHSLRHFAEEVLHTVTHLDNKFLQTLKLLFFKPGALTNAYLVGSKKLFAVLTGSFVLTLIAYRVILFSATFLSV